ncbi:hypothetical protein [Nostoc sp.]|uniref:hypothetical protein n=1 Tax=Nostoc sp. TaxID=1180 RepID=UPI002FFA0E46
MTIALKFEAYLLTASVGLLSDAIESCVTYPVWFVASFSALQKFYIFQVATSS